MSERPKVKMGDRSIEMTDSMIQDSKNCRIIAAFLEALDAGHIDGIFIQGRVNLPADIREEIINEGQEIPEEISFSYDVTKGDQKYLAHNALVTYLLILQMLSQKDIQKDALIELNRSASVIQTATSLPRNIGLIK